MPIHLHCTTLGCMTPAVPGKTRCEDCDEQWQADTERIRCTMGTSRSEASLPAIINCTALIPDFDCETRLDLYREPEAETLPFRLTHFALYLACFVAALLIIPVQLALPAHKDYVAGIQSTVTICAACGLGLFASVWIGDRNEWFAERDLMDKLEDDTE